MAKKVEPRTEILESPEALAEKLQGAETWMERHPKTIIGIAAVIALIVGGYFGYRYFVDNRNSEGQKAIFQAVYYFEADSLKLALDGDGNNLGFKAIAEDYSATDAGNLACFYAGVSYLKLGDFNSARNYLQDFSSSDLLVQARAYALIGDTYMEEGKYEDAAKFYDKAAGYKPNKYFTPSYLMKAGLAFERSNQNDKAIEAYDRIEKEFAESAEVHNAKKFKARLQGNS